MKCANCNNEISANTKFCTFCGAPVKKVEEKAVCPFCNAEINPGAAFCTSCGQSLSEPDAEAYSRQENIREAYVQPVVQMPVAEPVIPPAAAPVRTAKAKGKSPVLYVILGIVIALLIGAIAFLIFTMQKDTDKSSGAGENGGGEGTVEPVKENRITLKVDGAPSEVTEAVYTLSGTAEVSGKEAVLSINGEEIRTIYPDDGEVHWSEEVILEEGMNSFDIRLRDDAANYQINYVKIKYTAPEEDEEYLFPSDRQYITDSDLTGKTKEEVALIRNEIYARHGYIFNTEAYREYFSQKEWYSPNPDFSEAQLNEIELANKDFLVEYEESRGWR